jgi:hypothetical protein
VPSCGIGSRAGAHARDPGRFEEADLDRLDRVGRFEAEDLAIERQLRLERSDDVRRRAEAMVLAREEEIRVREAFLPERIDDLIGPLSGRQVPCCHELT